MFLQFFTSLREAQVPVTLREYLTLMEAVDADLAEQSVEGFYYLARAALVKDERNLDKFDRVFGTVFKGLESLLDAMEKADIPAEWLKNRMPLLVDLEWHLYRVVAGSLTGCPKMLN